MRMAALIRFSSEIEMKIENSESRKQRKFFIVQKTCSYTKSIYNIYIHIVIVKIKTKQRKEIIREEEKNNYKTISICKNYIKIY